MTPLWKPLPYSRLRECNFLNKIDEASPSNWIAAIKVYLSIVIKADVDADGCYCSFLSYPQLQKMTGMSRQLICNGLSKLKSFGIIRDEGVRKKKYIIMVCDKGSTMSLPVMKAFSSFSDGAWCKLPVKGLVDSKGRVSAFLAMSNRNVNELHALRLFIYLLSIRRKGSVFIVVGKYKLMQKLKFESRQLDMALSHMSSIGFIVKQRYRSGDLLDFKKTEMYAFLLCGWEVLEWNHNRMKELDWMESYIDDFESWS